jgi:hypothetical protein
VIVPANGGPADIVTMMFPSVAAVSGIKVKSQFGTTVHVIEDMTWALELDDEDAIIPLCGTQASADAAKANMRPQPRARTVPYLLILRVQPY